MATKKKVKAVEPEVVSSVEPEVVAVPMTMAAATPRANGQSANGFAKVEQGKSYVLSVNAPNGPGEVELLAADSDTQSESDMFSLLSTKVENPMQIPFVAVSSWVYVQAGSSYINWRVTPANFSLAVPGVSSGGGESFDPTADQTITGEWTFDRQVGFNSAVNISDAGYINLAGQISLQSTGGIEGPKIPDASIYDNLYLPTVNNDERYMRKTGNETVAGVKTFSSSPVVPIPAAQNQAANKKYVDANIIQVKSLLETTMRYVEKTKAEYNALSEKANNCIYYLTDQNMWAIGDKKLLTETNTNTDNIMYTHFAYLTTAETKGIVAPVVALPAEAPEGLYRVKLWFGPETSSAGGSQPCDIWITTTSASVSLPDISSNTSNLSICLNRASQLLVKGLDGNIYTCGFTSMGKRFTYPADSTLIGGELHVYHSASTPGSVKLSFKASSAEEEHDVVRVSFFQISGPVNQSE